MRDLDAGAVFVERRLHQLVHAALDVLPRAGEDRLNGRAADELAHGALGHRLHGALGLLDVEEIVAGAVRLDHPEHREIDIDDVLVAGEHQAFLGHVADGGAAPQILDQPHADIDAVDARDLGREHGLDRVRQVIVEAWLGVAHVLAEAQHHAELVRIDPEEAGEAPDRQRRQHDQGEPLAAEAAAGQHGPQLVLAAAQELFKIGWRRARLLRPRAPRALAPT